MLKAVFRLPLRQNQGFVNSLLEMAGFDLRAPDYSTLCRRSKDFDSVLREIAGNEPIEIAVDGTGLKVFGEEPLSRLRGYEHYESGEQR